MTQENLGPQGLVNSQPNRRRWLIGVVAGVAAVGGAALVWRREASPAGLSAAESALSD